MNNAYGIFHLELGKLKSNKSGYRACHGRRCRSNNNIISTRSKSRSRPSAADWFAGITGPLALFG